MDTMHGRGSPKSQKTFRGFACGNHEIIDYTEFGLGQINPIRYRSYYYDVETGLYYLKSRYYDPQTGRFISMDDINYLDPETIGGTNLYAYCNNPVNAYRYYDSTNAFARGRYLTNATTTNPIDDLVLYNNATQLARWKIPNGTQYLTGKIAGSPVGAIQYFVGNANWLVVIL